MSRRGRNSNRSHGDGWEQWGGYMHAKRQKLQEQFDQSAPGELKKEGSGSKIFSGISIHVNGYTKPSSDELKRLMMLHGGQYEHYLYRTRVTHVIATNLPYSKIRELKGLKVVRPEWITDSIAAGKLLSYAKYLLYSAQTGGLQKGLQSFTTVVETNNQSMEQTQSKNTQLDVDEYKCNIDDSTKENLAINVDESLDKYNAGELGLRDIHDTSVTDITSIRNSINDTRPGLVEQSARSGLGEQSARSGLGEQSARSGLGEQSARSGLGEQSARSGLGEQIARSGLGEQSARSGLGEQSARSGLGEQSARSGLGEQSARPGLGEQSTSRTVVNSESPAKAGDPKFLNEFYNNSRLHFLSTWKAEWKSYVNELQNKGANFPGREKLRQIVLQREVTSDTVSERELTADNIFKNPSKRRIMHIDMDCFFVSVGLRKRPDLRGKPVAVTHSRGKGTKPDPNSDLMYERRQRELKVLQGGRKGRGKRKEVPQNGFSEVSASTHFPDFSDSDDDNGGNNGDDNNDDTTSKTTTESFHSMAEIASCSYEARKAGVKNGMFMGRAKSVCPDLVTIPYDFDGYKEVSKMLYDTVASYTHDIEAVSCDEMLIDCTDLLRNTGATPIEFSTLLRSEIYNMTGCAASAGIGSSILLARMATRKAKPNGQFYLTEELVSEYIRNQPVKDLPGVGWSLTKRFEALNVRTCGELQTISLEVLQKDFGPKTGQSMYRYCRGQDDRPIKMEQQRKSVSAEVNYGIRFTTDFEATKFMEELSEEVCSRLKNVKMKGKSITLKLMVRRKDAPKETSKFMGHGICNNFSKSVSLPMATDESRIVAKETIGLLRQHRVEVEDLRGIGIQMQKLEPAEVGIMGTSKKLPSILNYTVNRKHLPDGSKGDNPRSVNCDKTVEKVKKLAFDTSNFDNLKNTKSVLGTNGKDLFQAENDHFGQDIETRTDGQNRVRHAVIESMENMTVETRKRTDDLIDMNEDKCGDEDFVEELGRRLDTMSQLPPLPSLPVIKTPESVKKSIRFNTPDIVDHKPEDYFPSPSQVDPEVLKELPVEIREQIEQEIRERRKKKATSHSNVNIGQGQSQGQSSDEPSCSHWQPNRGGHSKVENDSKRDNHDEAIVALPSPSQIDPSCLEALPESLQAELRQAYAKQDSDRRAGINGGNMLQLKQAKSPSKSPGKNKRSPGKHSPNFKVPKGRPSNRGKKKASLKKILFKDQNTTSSSVIEKSTTSKPSQKRQLSSAQENTNLTSEIIIDLCTDSEPDSDRNIVTAEKNNIKDPQSNSEREIIQLQPHSNSEREITQHQRNTNLEREIIQCHSDDNDLDLRDSVSLCGAVRLKDVKLLIREWISSTPYPQQEDEEVLITYLQKLVLDKNLEQVDLILKFMLRCINMLNSADWLFSLKRIYTSIQTVVYNLYGSRLVSITL
ncbi:deoxycytidyl transferase [Mactra antiquata]